jgi:hypothetical protein
MGTSQRITAPDTITPEKEAKRPKRGQEKRETETLTNELSSLAGFFTRHAGE